MLRTAAFHLVCLAALGLVSPNESRAACCSSLSTDEATLALDANSSARVEVSSSARQHRFAGQASRYEILKLPQVQPDELLEITVPVELRPTLGHRAFLPALIFLDSDKRFIQAALDTKLRTVSSDAFDPSKKGVSFVGAAKIPATASWVVLTALRPRAKDLLEFESIDRSGPIIALPGAPAIVLPGKERTVWPSVTLRDQGTVRLKRSVNSEAPLMGLIDLQTGLPLKSGQEVPLVVANDADCPFAYQERGRVDTWLNGRFVGTVRVGEFMTIRVPPGQHMLVLRDPVPLTLEGRLSLTVGEQGSVVSATRQHLGPPVLVREVGSLSETLPGNTEVGSGQPPRCSESR